MRFARYLVRDQDGVAAIEAAFAVPILVLMLWMFLQLAEVYRAFSGIQMALGEGSRYATLCLNPSATSGCTVPTGAQIHDQVMATVYGIGPGTFTANTPTLQGAGGGAGKYYDVTVTYSQPTSLLLVPGPTIHIGRSKRVWVAAS